MIIPKTGDRLLIDNALQTVKRVTTMFDRVCAMYEFGNNNHYIAIEALHLHSSQDFWFKEPLTDKF